MIGVARRWRTAIVLGAIACGLGAWLLFDRSGEGISSEREEALVPRFEASALRAFDLTCAGVTTHLERRDDGWWLDGKLGRADGAVVDSMLAAVEFARIDRRPTIDRKAAGLSPPRASLRTADSTISVGGDALGDGVFASRDGTSQIVVTDRHLAGALDVPPDALRAGALADGIAAARSITVGGLHLARRGAGWVASAGGDVVRADPDRAEALAKVLGEAHASRFVDGEAPAEIAITVDGDLRAQLGGPCPNHSDERFVRRADGAGLCLSTVAANALTASAASFATTSPAPVRVDKIRSLSLVSAGRALVVERAGGGWRIVTPAPGIGDELAVEGLIASLAMARGRPIKAGERFTSQPSGAHGELIADDGDRLVFTVIGRAGAEIVVRRDAEPGLLALPPTFAALIDPDPARIAAASDSPNNGGDGGPAKPLD